MHKSFLLLNRGLLASAALLFSVSVWAEPVKVAFIGDQGVGHNAQSVLSLIAEEGTDLLLIQGDLGYGDNTATSWNENLNNALGSNFPVLALVGNHENFEWRLYQSLVQQRVDRINSLSCSGNLGVKARCQYANIEIVQVAPGIAEVDGVRPDDDYASFINDSFSAPSDRWRICTWHKNQNRLQTGSKGDATGWDVYQACLDAGAMIAVAHEHAYARTFLLSDFQNQTIVHRNNDMTLEPGSSFAFVSGLGGREVRPQVRGGDWWASIYTANQGATHGALFCTFEETTAECYFKAIDGSVPDRFTVRRGTQANVNPVNVAAPEPTQQPSQDGYVFSRSDTEEYRWIARDARGELGSVWIDRGCAEQYGGPAASGDWQDLVTLAPGFDSIGSPCADGLDSSPAPDSSVAGYVFSRSDTEEYRWIDRDASGGLGNVWIDRACADQLGGPVAWGDWHDLVAVSPGFDSIASPCENNAQSSLNSQRPSDGYVFERTDKEEYRWIDQDGSGGVGNIWIDQACAERLGGPSVSGDWEALVSLSPRLDTIAYPCQ